MFDVDVSTLETVGEFGSKAWGEACADYGIKTYSLPTCPTISPGGLVKPTPTLLSAW